MSLNIEEEILISSGLLDDNYDPDSELEDGEEHLSAEDRKEELALAKEALQGVKGRISKLNWEGSPTWEAGKDIPNDKNFTVRFIFASPREELPVAYALGDIRLYCEPKQSLPGDSFKVIVINRMSPAVLHEPLTRDSFIDEISEELRWQLRGKCFNCRKPVEHDDEECGGCGQDLLEEEDEDEKPAGAEEAIPEVKAEVVPSVVG